MTELGKISKPDIAKYKDKKKIYFVRNIYLPQNATDKYKSIFNRYWKEVDEHLDKLEHAGKISGIFCESIYMTGEKAMEVLKTMNAQMEQIVKKKSDAGAKLIPLEDEEIFGAYIDWNNCMMIIRTSKVYDKVQEELRAVVKDRFKHIKSVFESSIGQAEAALLIMRGEDRDLLELPDDIELFMISPPAYDDLMKFLRDRDEGKEYWRS